jgi:hypothetical protein
MMTQTQLPFQYEIEKNESGLTAFAGLPLYVEMAMKSGLFDEMKNALGSTAQGWSSDQIVQSLMLLNLIGGDSVDEINRLEADDGLSTLFLKIETHGMRRDQRRAYEKRWRKDKNKAFPSASAIRRFLEQYHDAKEEDKRVEGQAFIPAPTGTLKKLLSLNSVLINFSQEQAPSSIATLDQDATLVPTDKKNALYSYKGFKAYQPFNTYWHEKGLILHSEFRDGNVPAGFQQLRCLKEALKQLPAGVETVMLRSDSAGYQQDLLKYCAEGENERFGAIAFAISANVTQSFKNAVSELKDSDWQPIFKGSFEGRIKTEQEWAEVCYVPNWVALRDKSIEYRFIAIRDPMAVQEELEGIEAEQKSLPFQTVESNNKRYKLFNIITNRKIDGNELINWHRERCGDSEKVHSIQKHDFAGGQLPSNKFGANAAWWQIMILTLNLNCLMQKLVLPEGYKSKRMKAIRLHIIGVPGKFVKHARGLIIRIGGKLDIGNLMQEIRDNIAALKPAVLLSG